MLSFFKKLIKSEYLYIAFICFLALFSITAVLALNAWDKGFRSDSGTTILVDIKSADGAAYDDCKEVENTSTHNYFIPTKTEAEWDSFKNAAGSNFAITLNE